VVKEVEKRPKTALVKLYDENVRAFKLNDNVTFIGVLEFNQREPGDIHMSDDDSGFNQGIPNEQTLPHLHAITFRRNLLLKANPIKS
jgi:hypothetical protein